MKDTLKFLLILILLGLYGCTETIIEPAPEPPEIVRKVGEIWAQREYRDGYDRIIFEWLEMHNDDTVWLHWIEPAGEWCRVEWDKTGNYHWLRFAEDEKKRPATEEEIAANP